MGKQENDLSFLGGQDQEDIVGVKLKPEHFSNRALLRISAFQFAGKEPRQCTLIWATGTVTFSPEYFRDVYLGDPEVRFKHIVDTALAMRKAIEIHIQNVDPQE